MLHIGTRKGLFLLDDAGAVQRVSFLGVPVTAVLPARDGALYAAVGHGHFGAKLHRSRDNGASWEEIAAPKWPQRPEGLDEKDPVRGGQTSWSLNLMWILEEDPRSGALWCGTIPGGLFKSEDKGASWIMNMPLWDMPARKQWFGGGYDWPGIHSVCANASGLMVGVSCGGVWHSADEGKTWEARTKGMYAAFMPPERREDPVIQDPHRVAACAAQPEVLWTQHHNGVFRSTDGGRQWIELHVPPSSFGFAVAAHPRDPLTAWFVPAVKDETRVPVDGKLVVTRTRDGGKTFEVLRKGLPQEHAYDLIYRHALDVDASGTRLAMASTTGSAWLSADSGDSWQLLSHHLPPVYCIRFS
jgi:hypothetical protein